MAVQNTDILLRNYSSVVVYFAWASFFLQQHEEDKEALYHNLDVWLCSLSCSEVWATHYTEDVYYITQQRGKH